MSAFTFETNIDVEKIGRSGYYSIPCKVTGYWSSDTITVYVDRSFGEWRVRMSHSSGGRDTKEVVCDLEAEENFGHALIAMSKFAQKLKGMFDQFEVFFQIRCEEDRAERKAEEDAIQAKIDADAELGLMEADRLVLLMTQGNPVRVFNRGSDRAVPASCSIRGNTTFYYCGERTSKKRMIELLAKSSHRSGVMEKQ